MFISPSPAGADPASKPAVQPHEGEIRRSDAFAKVFNDISKENSSDVPDEDKERIQPAEPEIGEEPAQERDSLGEIDSDSEPLPVRMIEPVSPHDEESSESKAVPIGILDPNHVEFQRPPAKSAVHSVESIKAGTFFPDQNPIRGEPGTHSHQAPLIPTIDRQTEMQRSTDPQARGDSAKPARPVDSAASVAQVSPHGQANQLFASTTHSGKADLVHTELNSFPTQSLAPGAGIEKKNPTKPMELLQGSTSPQHSVSEQVKLDRAKTATWQSTMAVSVSKPPVSNASISEPTPVKKTSELHFNTRLETIQPRVQTAVESADSTRKIASASVPNVAVNQILSDDPSRTLSLKLNEESGFFEALLVRDSAEVPGTASHLTTSTVSQQSSQMRFTPALVADSLVRAPDRPIEIALNPEELGRVRMALTTTETGIVLAISAERSETLELMRRNIEDLAAEFRRMGYEDIGFQFGTGSDQHMSKSESGFSTQTKQDAEQMSSNPEHPLRLATTGLDMRL